MSCKIMVISKGDSIAIIGGGKFSLSTALELSNKGYTDITVFEKDDEIPSRWSAANDLNKTMRAEYEGDFYTDLAVVSHTEANTASWTIEDD
jgi:sarcosine oxidase/L-pipecolate oxidase